MEASKMEENRENRSRLCRPQEAKTLVAGEEPCMIVVETDLREAQGSFQMQFHFRPRHGNRFLNRDKVTNSWLQ